MFIRCCRYSLFRTGPSILLILFLFGLLSACSPVLQAAAVTRTPLPNQTETISPTSVPTLTYTPEPSATPTATATATPDSTGTAVATATAGVVAALEHIQPYLDEYDIPLDGGHQVWFGEKAQVISLKQHGEEVIQPVENLEAQGDFLLHSEMKWDTTTGLAGCGLVLRSDEDLEKGEQYRFAMMRLENMPGWDIEYWNYGL